METETRTLSVPRRVTLRREGRVWYADVEWSDGKRWVSWAHGRSRAALVTHARDRLGRSGFDGVPIG